MLVTMSAAHLFLLKYLWLRNKIDVKLSQAGSFILKYFHFLWLVYLIFCGRDSQYAILHPAESEKPMSHGGIATWKVFARPESFCAYLWNPPIKDMPKCPDFQMVWKVYGWSGKFPDGLENFRMVCKISGWSVKFPDGLESFQMGWKVSG